MTTSVVAALMLHNQSCSRCRMGEPCLVSERIQDEWLRQQAARQGESPPAPWLATEDAA
ncbi:hypothetical protein [Dyella flagellata]|uniref:Uncharacterized protein n=1 Tax=Dyella flagellata TaxID=1867833 RepID=A0ABQ5X919_9GAMM|nr:hypothetical protein [Dyella flagellata]GLQ88165.1 hypothetical protein GCM10007898_17340 [Dyella flagellata]